MRTLGRDFATGAMHGGQLCKITRVCHPAEMALLFDGAKCHNPDANNISLRHANGTRCNFLFADAHCESVRGDQLPNGSDTPSSPSNTSDFDSVDQNATNNLTNHPFPRWRLDQ